MYPEVETGVKTTNTLYDSELGFEIKSNGLYWNGNIVYNFMPEDKLKETKGHYLYVDSITDNGNLVVKYGEALEQTIYKRWGSTGQHQRRRMFRVWECEVKDTKTHNHLRDISKTNYRCGYKPYLDFGSVEEYEIVGGIDGLKNFLCDIEVSHKEQNIGEHFDGYQQSQTFDSVNKAIDEIDELINNGNNVIFCEFCARFGKTKMNVERLRRSKNERIKVVLAYVNTVYKSYKDEVASDKNIIIVNVNDYKKKSFEAANVIQNFLDLSEDNKVIIYIPLTGDDNKTISLFNKRTCGIINICKKYGSFVVDEEADFGSKCPNQIKKLNKICRKIDPTYVLVETGTNIESTYGIFKNEDGYKCYKSIRKNYIIDVLGDKSRTNAVKIKYNVLYNTFLTENIDSYLTEEMENFAYFFSLNKNGKLNGELYLRQFVRYLFNPEKFAFNISDKKMAREIANTKHINDKFATILFTPEKGIIEYGEEIKRIVEEEVGNEYTVVLLNSYTTTNIEAEEDSNLIIESNWKRNNNNKVIFIMGSMGNRSWSVEEVKNIVLMIDGASYASLMQKIARGLTNVKKRHNENLSEYNWCNILDLRLNNVKENNHLREFISGVANASINSGMGEDEVMDVLCDIDKIQFYEYYKNGYTNPIQKLDVNDLYKIFRTREYCRNKAISMFSNGNLDRIPYPDPKYTGADNETPDGGDLAYAINNIKGRGKNPKKRGGKGNKTSDGGYHKNPSEDINFDRQKQHFYFFWNKIDIFNTHKYEGCEDWIYREFEDIKSNVTIKNEYSKAWNVDMDTIIGYVDLLKSKKFKFNF